MSIPPKVDPIPNGMTAVTPHLVCAGAAEAIDFYQKAFGAVEVGRLPMPDGRVLHAGITINGAMIMLVDEMPEWGALGPNARGGTSVTIHLQVEDADALFARAVATGAKVIMPVDEAFWGDRYGQVEDPYGHRWSIATHVRDVSDEDIIAASAEMGGCGGGD